jgi:hypothetical protein
MSIVFPAGFIVPDCCETWVNLHVQPDQDPAALQEDKDPMTNWLQMAVACSYVCAVNSTNK